MRCFSSPGSPRIPMDSVYDTITLLMVSSLIRKSAGQRSFATLRSLSQLVTSFFGAIYQGILLCALCSLIFKSFDCIFAIRRIISFDTFQKILKLNFSVIIVLTFFNACINHLIFKFLCFCLLYFVLKSFYAVVNLLHPLHRQGFAISTN